ncbi:hypothetical protein BDZ94DRAFT_1196100 [Collybia nuda]|uniref:Peptidase S54 rhomboid domain-containing protein n=1 Tax=Collybia nuda TaxID=64659 RepID=A0A9P5Y159_9AGAR|nr:hypothetical protein BDZ94DRAFT_1196100 [Collybia nuda]
MFCAHLRRYSPRNIHSCILRPSTRSFSQTTFRSAFRPTRLLRQEPQPQPQFREETVRERFGEAFTERIGRPHIRNQVMFVVFGSALVFSYAAVRTNIETEYWTKRLTASSFVWSTQSITSVDLKRAQNAEVIKDLREWYAYISGRIQEVPGLLRPWVGIAYVAVMQPYADASEGKRLCWKICLFNAAVWAAWKFRRLQGPMRVSFMHHPLSGLSYTLLTSMFSHRSFLHLAFNCLALESFGSAAYYYFLREQDKSSPPQLESTAAWHFLGFFISAGLFSGLVSHVVSAKFRYPRLIAQLASPARTPKATDTWASAVAASAASAKAATKKAVPDILPSLGASGAVYGAVTLTALAFPESQVALFIPPSYPISIQWGVGGLVLMDIVGILRGWRYLDHWAHLGGAAFGVAYYAYGPAFWRGLRQRFQSPNDRIAT